MARLQRLGQWIELRWAYIVVRIALWLTPKDVVDTWDAITRMRQTQRRLEKVVARARMTPLMRLTDEVWDDEEGAPGGERQAEVV